MKHTGAGKYRLLALDVDGTLVGPDSRVPAETATAIAEADAAGLKVCLATGRSYKETLPVWRQLSLDPPYEPMVLNGGSLVSEPDTGRTLYQRTIRLALACEFADALDRSGYSALALMDPWRHGVDYVIAESGDADKVHRLWFSQMDVRLRRVRRLDEADGMPDPLRLSAVVEADDADELTRRFQEQFAGRLNVHSILAPNYGVTVLEAFSSRASKHRGVIYVAQAHRIPPGRIVAVGDDVNDLAMIRGAGLGVTFPHSPPSVRAAAGHVAEAGLAEFIRQLVAGDLDNHERQK